MQELNLNKSMKNFKTLQEYLNESNSTLEMENVENYMFFQNLRTIKSNIEKLLSLDILEVDRVLHDGHNWAEDHISTAKESIEQVTQFFINKDY